MNLCTLFRWLCCRPKAGHPYRLEVVFHLSSGAKTMDITIPLDEPLPLAVSAVYRDRAGNVTKAPDGVTLSWTDSNPAAAAIDGTSGEAVNITALGTTIDDTTDISVTDGALTGSGKVTLGAGKPASLSVEFAPLS